MLRAILKLIAVGAVIAVCGTADSPELYAAGGGALLVLPFAIHLLDRGRARVATGAPRQRTTLDVIPLPAPPTSADDPEGVTVRAPMSHEEAYEMHARYAPSFDQQLAIARYEAQHGGHQVVASAEHHPSPAFDQGRYAAALQYADAFEAQLSRTRRTAAYEVAAPRRMARGSVTPRTYRAVDMRSDQRPSDWDDKTLVGVPPHKRFK